MAKLWLLPFVLLVTSASADTVHLTTGGKITGTITQVTFITAGEEKVVEGESLAEIDKLHLGLGQDTMTVGGKQWQGKLKSVRIKSIGGALTFGRRKITRIVRQLTEREKLLAQYRSKLEGLQEGDATGWYALAAWAEQRRLRREALSAARTSLDLDPGHAHSANAHRMLGHVFKNDQWLTPAEVKELEELEGKKKEDEMRAKGFVKLGGRWVTQEEKDGVEVIVGRIRDMEEAAIDDLENWANGRAAAALQELDRAKGAARSARKSYENKKDYVKNMGRDGWYHTSSYVASQHRSLKDYKDRAQKAEEQVPLAGKKLQNTVSAVKTKVSKLKRSIHNAAVRLIRQAERGEEVDERDLEDELTLPDLD